MGYTFEQMSDMALDRDINRHCDRDDTPRCFFCENEATHRARIVVDVEPGDDGQVHSIWSEEDVCKYCFEDNNNQEGGAE